MGSRALAFSRIFCTRPTVGVQRSTLVVFGAPSANCCRIVRARFALVPDAPEATLAPVTVLELRGRRMDGHSSGVSLEELSHRDLAHSPIAQKRSNS